MILLLRGLMTVHYRNSIGRPRCHVPMILRLSINPDGAALLHLGCTPFICSTVSYIYSHNAHNTEIKSSAGENDALKRHGLHRLHEAAAGPTADCFTIDFVRSRNAAQNRSTANTEASRCVLLPSPHSIIQRHRFLCLALREVCSCQRPHRHKDSHCAATLGWLHLHWVVASFQLLYSCLPARQ